MSALTISLCPTASATCATGTLPAGTAGGVGEAASVPVTTETAPLEASITTRSVRGSMLGAAMVPVDCAATSVKPVPAKRAPPSTRTVMAGTASSWGAKVQARRSATANPASMLAL